MASTACVQICVPTGAGGPETDHRKFGLVGAGHGRVEIGGERLGREKRRGEREGRGLERRGGWPLEAFIKRRGSRANVSSGSVSLCAVASSFRYKRGSTC